jgi:hypothetical protein
MKDLLDSMKKALPRYNAVQPSTGKKIIFRPFTVREEKALLMANDTGTYEDFLTTLADTINVCFDLQVDCRQLPLFDVEYFFLKLRCKSIGELIDSTVICPITGEKINITLNLDEIEPTSSSDHSRRIELQNMIVTMKYPTLSDFIQRKENMDYYDLLVDSISTIETPNELIESSNTSREQLLEFIDLLTKDQFKKLVNFFKSMPRIEKELKYTTSDNIERKIILKGIKDFFR